MDDVTETYDPYHEDAIWQLKFAFLPKKCYLTGETIWFGYAYRGHRAYGGFHDEPEYDIRWVKKDEWLVEKIKGRI